MTWVTRRMVCLGKVGHSLFKLCFSGVTTKTTINFLNVDRFMQPTLGDCLLIVSVILYIRRE